MEKSKKIISLLLALIMTLSVFTIVPFSAGAAEADVSPVGATETDVSPVGAPESYTDIHIGDTLFPIEINGEDATYFKFVPERDMSVFFTSQYSYNAIAYLYDEQMNLLASSKDRLDYDFYGLNFKIIYNVTAGNTYYYAVKYTKSGSTDIDVGLNEIPEIKVGETAAATLPKYGGHACFKYVPEQDMHIDLTVYSSKGIREVYLYDEHNMELARRFSEVSYILTAGKAYYFCIFCTASSADVELQGSVCSEIKVSETKTATIENEDDTVYFKFVPERDMGVEFTSLSDSDTQGSLYDADMKELASDDNSGSGSNFKIIYPVTAGMTYYFDAKFKDSSTGTFDVQLQEYVYPEIKVGDTATATINDDGDTAYFKFVPDQDMRIDFNSRSNEDTCGSLYDADMKQLASDDNSGSQSNFKIVYDVTAGTTYYFGAKLNSDSSTGSFDVQLQDFTLNVGETATATINKGGDIDCFKFIPEQDMSIEYFSLSDEGTYGYLYDADMKELAFDDHSGSGSNFKIIYSVTAGTTYYLGAKYKSGSSTGSFDVKLNKVPDIKVGETKTAAIESGSAYFKFVPEQDMNIDIILPSDSYVYNYLYDADMQSLWCFNESHSGSNYTVSYHVTAGTTYYLCVGLNTYSTGSIDVQLQEHEFPEIKVGETKTATIENEDDTVYFKFVPERDMGIDFTSLSDEDTKVCLYDADMKKLAPDDNSGSQSDFKITYYVIAGKTYYLRAMFNSDSSTGSFDVQLQEHEYPEIKIGETKKVTTTYDETKAVFKFVCEKDMLIEFFGVTDENDYDHYTYGYLYDANMEEITSELDREFRFTRYVTAGQTYYLGASIGTIFDGFDVGTGTFDVTLREVALWEHDGSVLTRYNGYDENVTIPSELDGVAITSIGNSVFSGCTGLTSVTIPDSVTSIGNYAFAGCSSLTSITIPDSITSVGYSAFYDTPWENSLPDGLAYVGKVAYKMIGDCPAEVVIKDGTASIAEHAFEDCTSLTSVTIPDSVTSIGDDAFFGCPGLTSVTIPDSVTSIGDDAFGYYYDDDWNWCKVDGFTIYGYANSAAKTYANANDFTFVRVTEGKTGDCRWSVDGTVLTIFGNGKMGDYDWFGGPWDPDITEVIIEDGVTNIGEYAFYSCESLTSVTIGNSVTSIGDEAFRNCDILTSVTIPDSVTSIGSEAFAGCSGLTSVTIPDSVTSIGKEAFAGCTGLLSITVDPENTVYDSRENCNAVISTNSNEIRCGCKTTVIPSSVTSIGEYAFSNCTELTSMTIPDSITSIGEYAFSACTELTSVTIPDSVTSIGFNAFEGCTNLKSVTIPASVTSIGNFAIGWVWANSGWRPIEGFTVYGYAGTAAESYVKDNHYLGSEDITFIALSDKADSDTGITASVTADVTLDVKDITGTDAVGNIQLNSETILKTYDITLTKGGETVQPENMVTVKIPCADKTAKVYRVEANGSLTDMHAVYTDGYLVFTTDHFSVYIVAVDEPEANTLLGDADCDDTISILDATAIQRVLADFAVKPFNEKAACVTGEDLSILDATMIQRYLADFATPYHIGDYVK